MTEAGAPSDERPRGVLADYFANHERARRLPWSLYHRPLEADLARFLACLPPRARVLVIGCGLMHELDRAPRDLRITVADVDARAVEAVLARGDARIERGVVVDPEQPIDAYVTDLDAIYAKEVIEHVVPWQAWLAGVYRALAPGGALWLSTPNYGEPWLAALEATALELVARRDGFTRKGLHPSRFSRRSLARGLADAGFTRVRARSTLHRLALTAWATRPR
jgi:SAM-dependent methyltransferase